MAAGRQFKPGPRNPKFRQDGKMSEARLAWMRTAIGQFVIMRDDSPIKEVNEEIGYTYRLALPRPTGRQVMYNFTALTMDEFVLIKQFFNLLFDLAEPVIRERDKVAQDAFDQGDDSYARIYRQIPQLVIREGAVRTDDQGIWDRPKDLPEGDQPVVSLDGGLRGDSDELAPEEPEDSGSEDDESETY